MSSTRFANIEFENKVRNGCGEVVDIVKSRWVYEVPGYLRPSLVLGDNVLVEHDGELKAGTVAEMIAATHLKPHQVGVIIDSFDYSRWVRFKDDRKVSEQLIEDMAAEKERIDALAGFRKAAKKSPAMAELVEQYDLATHRACTVLDPSMLPAGI